MTEGGPVCGSGKDAAGFFSECPTADGHPTFPHGTWNVGTGSTGQFAGLGGSGTNALVAAGAHASGSYTGTLGP